MSVLNLGLLASHGGSNLQAIIDACKAGSLQGEPRVMLSNNSHSGALQRARREGIPAYHLSGHTHPDPAALDQAILEALRRHEVEVVCLAGYMKKLGARTLQAYRGRILNIHPALLPRFGGQGMYGMRVHQAVLGSGEGESGATVHLVDEQYDHGPILAQARVRVLPGDTAEALAARVLEAEHRLYAETLQRIATGEMRLEGLRR